MQKRAVLSERTCKCIRREEYGGSALGTQKNHRSIFIRIREIELVINEIPPARARAYRASGFQIFRPSYIYICRNTFARKPRRSHDVTNESGFLSRFRETLARNKFNRDLLA